MTDSSDPFPDGPRRVPPAALSARSGADRDAGADAGPDAGAVAAGGAQGGPGPVAAASGRATPGAGAAEPATGASPVASPAASPVASPVASPGAATVASPGAATGASPGAATGAALPRYVQISEMLIREIAAGHLAEGTRLPPERDMAATLGTSVGTLRKALADLADKGLLDRIQGSGNYVRARPVEGSVYAFFRLERVRGGGLPTAQVLNVERLPKPEAAPPFGPSAQAHRIRRLRRLDGEPVALEEIWLDGARAPRIREADLSESLYLFYRRDLHLVIGRVEDRIGLSPVPDWTAPEWLGPQAHGAGFGLPPGAPAGHVERLGRDQSGAAVEYSRTWFDSEKARYVSRMGKG